MTATEPARRGRPPLLDLPASPPPVSHPRWQDATVAMHLDAARQALSAARAVLAATEQLMGTLAEYHRTAPPPRTYPDDPHWATVKEAADHLRLSRERTYRLLNTAPAWVRQNQRLVEKRVSLVDLDRWVAEEQP